MTDETKVFLTDIQSKLDKIAERHSTSNPDSDIRTLAKICSYLLGTIQTQKLQIEWLQMQIDEKQDKLIKVRIGGKE